MASLHRSREILYPSEYLPTTLEIHTHRDPRCGGAINRRAAPHTFCLRLVVECVSFSLSLSRGKPAVMAQRLRCFVNRRLFAARRSSALSRPAPVLCILLSSASVPRPPLPFLSVQSSAVVTSFVREEANVIYEQSRRRRRRRRRRRTRSGLRRIPIAIPSVPIKLLFSAGALGMRR